jgi:uncharacterized protein (TIGR03437 family)
MKCFSVFLLSAACLCAQDGSPIATPAKRPVKHLHPPSSSPFGSGSTAASLPKRTGSRGIGDAGPFGSGSFQLGQAARLVVGQTTFTAEDPNSSDTVIGAASGVAFAGDTLFVADSNRIGALPSNNRVLLFQNASSMFPSPTAALNYSTKCPVCVGQANVVLGQPDFTTTTLNFNASASALRNPTSIASDGVHLVVADTDHNRVLIWNSIPGVNDQPADVVVGQPDFVSVNPSANPPNSTTLRGPQGVWIQNGKLYVADTINNRVLIYNHIPTANGAAADVVLGAPNFTTYVAPDIGSTSAASASNMLDPVSVTSDGTRLFVSDLGQNRVLAWNSIPTTNGAAANFALGQPDLVSSTANNAYSTTTTTGNNTQTCSGGAGAGCTPPGTSGSSTTKESPVLCPTVTGTDPNGNPTYDGICNATISFPRFALSTGSQLFVADGGNDRILVYNTMPGASGTSADLIIGQIGGDVDQATDAADSLSTPMSLAWDGVNLYVADVFNRRITVYSPGLTTIPYQGVTNSATVDVTAFGTITIAGTIEANDVVTVTINSTNYTYTVKATDALSDVVQALVNAVNSSNSGQGDPNVIATVDTVANEVVLTSRQPGGIGNQITLASSVSSGATVTATASGANLAGGNDAATVGPGTIVTIHGASMSAQTASADTSQNQLPTTLGGTTVYFNGIPAPLFYVSPGQINAQIPWEVNDSTSINAYVRSVLPSGNVQVTTPVAVTIVPANPGIYTQSGTNPPLGVAFHGSSYATAIVSVDGTTTANDTCTITVQDRTYTYTVQAGDTLDTVRDNLIALINQTDPTVTAYAAGVYDRIIIQARIQGPIADGVPITATSNAGSTEVMTAFSNNLCCANVAGSPITINNPALPGEFIEVYATGLGLPILTDALTGLLQTGYQWPVGAPDTQPTTAEAVSALAGGSTADVISASLLQGSVGMFKVLLHLNSSLGANSATPLTIAQDVYVSNIVYIPVSGLGSQ